MEKKYYKMPVSFFENEKYSGLTTNEMIMYAILYEKYESSKRKKSCKDEDGTFIYYTVRELTNSLHISKQTVINGLKHLEEYNLIFREKTDGKADKIYVHEPETEEKEGL